MDEATKDVGYLVLLLQHRLKHGRGDEEVEEGMTVPPEYLQGLSPRQMAVLALRD